MKKKILIGSIITIAILVLVSTTSAVDEKIILDEENKPIDSTIEIISFIRGSCWKLDPPGLFGIHRNLELHGNPGEGDLHFTSFTINPIRLFSVPDPYCIVIPLFIGIIIPISPFDIDYFVRGIGFGNIEWWGFE